MSQGDAAGRHAGAGDPTPDPAYKPLVRAFYERLTVDVARDLLGRYLVLEEPSASSRVGRIVETEAYVGGHDRASHARAGYTTRTAPMYEAPGHAYMYRIYGMYWCLNAVTEPPGTPCAVLIRAVEPIAGLTQATDGPGKLCRAYGLDGRWNRADLTQGPLRITVGAGRPATIATSSRIGVPNAGTWAEEPLRFTDTASPYVSRRTGTRVRPPR